MDYQITYPGKMSVAKILERTPVAMLSETQTIGNAGFNRLILGDNLPILQNLRHDLQVKGKVRLVYIDPPYSTQRIFGGKSVWYQHNVKVEHQELAYHDTLSGAEYLEFIRQRLILIRELMSDDGTIYVHLDDKMAFPIKVMMDEIFGESHFRNWITRRKCSSKNYTRNQFGNITDYLLCYSKGDEPIWNRPFGRWSDQHAAVEYPKIERETGRRYKLVPIYAHGKRNGDTGQPWRGMLPPKGKHWFTSPENLDKLEAEGRIYWSPTGNPRKKVYLDESPGVPYSDLWLNFRDAHNQNVSVTGYPTEKNLDMLKLIVAASSNEGDIILDCFAGSGTTLVAAQQLHRRWIGIDSSPLALSVSIERLGAEVSAGPDLPLFAGPSQGFSVMKATLPHSVATQE